MFSVHMIQLTKMDFVGEVITAEPVLEKVVFFFVDTNTHNAENFVCIVLKSTLASSDVPSKIFYPQSNPNNLMFTFC